MSKGQFNHDRHSGMSGRVTMRGGLETDSILSSSSYGDFREISRNISIAISIISMMFILLAAMSAAVSAQINYTSPKQYDTLIQGKNQIIKINHDYPSASIFWFVNGNLIESNNNKKEILFNTTRFILDNPGINFDDQNVDAKVLVKVIDTTNPFNSANYSWEFFVEPLDYSMTTDKSSYYTGQTILLHFNAQPDTKLDISVYNGNSLVMKYPTVTVKDINEFLIDSPDNPGTYTIKVDTKYYEYSKKLQKSITVTEDTQMALDNNFVRISIFPENPSVNETLMIKAIMNNYDNLEFKWDLNSDGSYEKTGKDIQAVFDKEKQYILKLYVRNKQTGEDITRFLSINVGDEQQVVKLTVKDFFTKNSVSNSKIIVNGNEYSTSSSGEVTISLRKGTYALRVVNPDYNEYSQSLEIKSNYVQTIYLYKSDEFERAIKGDVQKPVVTLISPKSNDIKTDLFTTFEYNASDDIYLSTCTLYVKPKTSEDWVIRRESDGLGDKTHQKIVLDLAFNTYLYKVICTDKKNNQASSETREFSISQYATQMMYQDDVDRITKFIADIDDAITNPKGDNVDDDLNKKIYDIYHVDENLVRIGLRSRQIKDNFTSLLMNKENPVKINDQINLINKFMEESSHSSIKYIKVMQKRQFLKSSTKERIRQVIDEMYQNLFDETTLNKLADNIFLKQDNLQVMTKIIKVRVYYLDNKTKDQIIFLNEISQKNMNENSIIYQLIPNEVTSNPQSIEVNKSYGEMTKTTDNSIIMTIYPQKTDNEPYYIINDNPDLDRISSLETILIDNGDRTESIKKIAQKTNDIESLSDSEKPNILNNIDTGDKSSAKPVKSVSGTDEEGLDDIQGKAITEFPDEYTPRDKLDIIPYFTFAIVAGIMLATAVMLFRNGGTGRKEKESFDKEIEFLQNEVSIMQTRIAKKIEHLIKEENKYINEVSEGNKAEMKIIEKTADEIGSERNPVAKEELISAQRTTSQKDASRSYLDAADDQIRHAHTRTQIHVHASQAAQKTAEKKHSMMEFYVDDENSDAKDKIFGFSEDIEKLKNDLV